MEIGRQFKPGNMKAKPGSQGTLFGVADKSAYNPAKRYPRGYTPERQADVNLVLGDVVDERPKRQASEDAIQASVNKAFSIFPDVQEPEDTTQRTAVQSKKLRATVVGHLSRSAIPASDIEGISRVAGVRPKDMGEHAYADYDPNTTRVRVGIPGDDNFHADPKLGFALTHEVGHHADSQGIVEDYVNHGDLHVPSRGRQEAVADSIAGETATAPDSPRSGYWKRALGQELASRATHPVESYSPEVQTHLQAHAGRTPATLTQVRQGEAHYSALPGFTDSYLQHYSHPETHPARVAEQMMAQEHARLNQPELPFPGGSPTPAAPAAPASSVSGQLVEAKQGSMRGRMPVF